MRLLAGRYKTMAVLTLIWIAAASLNITKAVHMDDTAYLEIAKHIIDDPLHPMSGKLNWSNSESPIHYTNQPPLLFYLFSLTISIFGESEIALHLLAALFSLAAISFFYLLAHQFAEEHALPITALFCLSPAFIPSQNLMTDIPMIALWNAFFWAILASDAHKNPFRRYLFCAAVAAAACLIKYVSLVLLPILLLDIALKKRWRMLWVAGIPLIVLVGWSAFNYYDYGGVHILSRPVAPLSPSMLGSRSLSWVIGLGAVSPFSIICIPYLMATRERFKLLSGCLLFSVVIFFLSIFSWGDTLLESVLRALFFGNGLLLFGLTLSLLVQRILFQGTPPDRGERDRYLVLLAWLAGASSFIILLARFIAVRHLITVIPVVVLVLGAGVFRLVKRRWLYAGLIATVSLGFALGISDWTYADVYRVQAARIKRQLEPKADGTIWYLGHWGWQWYAGKAGMRQYDLGLTVLSKGDLLVVPHLAHKQVVGHADLHRLRKVDEVTVDSTSATLLRIMWIPQGVSHGGYYSFSQYSLPWTLTKIPLEEFNIFVVDKP